MAATVPISSTPISSTNSAVRQQFGDPSYPMRDGRPMGETDTHRRVIFDLIGALESYYAGQQVYVSGDLLLHYERGNRRRHVSPDVLVTKGLELGDRLNYILWEEGVPPNMVIEVTSKTTRREDLETKFAIYRDKIKVPEYFLFDPLDEYLKPQLQGYRLRGGEYLPIRPTRGRFLCKQLGLELEANGTSLRFIEQQTGRMLLSPREQAEEAREQAEVAREQAAEDRLGRAKAEQELVRLRAELARLRKK